MELALELITPVHIGNGEIISPFCDYIYDSYNVYFIDHHKLEHDVFAKTDSEKVIDDFINIVRSQASGNSSTRFQLRDFFRNNNLDFKQYTIKKLETSDDRITEEIKKIVQTGARPYIPGSSIKGAIRTALLYEKLKPRYDFQAMNVKDYIGQDQFGKFANDIMKHLSVSDSEPIIEASVKIYRTNRFNLFTKKKTVNVVREAILPGVKSHFRLQTKGRRGYHSLNAGFDYLYEGSETEILRIVNEFYDDTLNNELNILRKANLPELDLVVKRYSELLDELGKLKATNDGAIMRIGSGKTFFENTIAGLFREEDLKNTVSSFLRAKNPRQAAEVNIRSFPKTRTVVIEKGLISDVLGWVRVKRI